MAHVFFLSLLIADIFQNCKLFQCFCLQELKRDREFWQLQNLNSVTGNTMKTVIYIVLFSFIQLSAAFAQTTNPDIDKLTAEVHELFDINKNLPMYENRDIDGLVNRFTKDGSLKVPGAPRISGHDALWKHYDAIAGPQPDVDFNYSIVGLDISEAGDMAVVSIEFLMLSLVPGSSFRNSGVILMVLKRVDDQWKIFAENMSSGPVNLSEE